MMKFAEIHVNDTSIYLYIYLYIYIYPLISRLFITKTNDITYPSYIPFKYFLQSMFSRDGDI